MIALQAQGGMGNLVVIVMLIAVFIVFIIIPQFKRQKQLKKFRNNMKKGDYVTTTGGIIGRIVSIDDDSVVIVSDEKTKLKVYKQSIVSDVQGIARAR